MKITIVKKAPKNAKPSNACPWFIDEPPSPTK